jgi:hypothetical protein
MTTDDLATLAHRLGGRPIVELRWDRHDKVTVTIYGQKGNVLNQADTIDQACEFISHRLDMHEQKGALKPDD